jgi:hypothetical protein
MQQGPFFILRIQRALEFDFKCGLTHWPFGKQMKVLWIAYESDR